MTDLHKDAIVIDGLIISNWSRAVFEDMKRGGLTAANCTCSVWDGFKGTMENIAQWKGWFEEHNDLLLPVHTTEDIRRAKQEDKVGIILGWQNTGGIEDRVEFLKLFKELGVGVMQLTYNTQNLVGTGCWESVDSGLSDFGREVIDEMNRVGILVDLSHVGAQTSEEAILHSKKPVAYTHCAPNGMKEYPRNKTDEQLRFIADRGGFVGVCTFPPFLPWGADTNIENCIEEFDYVINVVGEDCVGVGTDFTQDQDAAFFDYLSFDKGHGRRLVPKRPGGVVKMPEGLRTIGEFPNLTAAMERAGWPESKIRKVMGENWMRVLKEVWALKRKENTMSIIENHCKKQLDAGKLALGFGVLQSRKVDIAKIAKTCGYDWLFVDLEHSAMDLDTASQICVAALDVGITPLVRVSGHEHFHAARILDNGAMGIVVPHVDTVEEARAAVDHVKFPPIGHRSMTGGLSQVSFENHGVAEQPKIINAQTMVVIMLETPTAIENAEAIAAVDGVDVLLIGTNDLCAEMGIPGEFGHDRVEAAYDSALAAAQKHGKHVGLGGIYDEALVKKFVDKGVRFILGGADLGFLMAAASARSAFLRGLED